MNAGLAVVLGCGMGIGLLIIARGSQRRPVPLARVVARLDRVVARPAAVSAQHELSHTQRRLGGIGLRLLDSLNFVDTAHLSRQLRVLDKSVERHAYEKVLAASVGFSLPVVVAVILRVGAGTDIGSIPTLLAAVTLATVGFFYPDLPLNDRVSERRLAFRHALSSYLNMVTIAIAGGAGIESALEGAAEGGDGWAFAELRSALRYARVSNETIWDQFEKLGHELGVAELVELASSVALAGGQGAKVKQSLVAKAESLQSALAAQLEADAESQSERMIVPVTILILALTMFIGYGAVEAISTPGEELINTPTTEP